MQCIAPSHRDSEVMHAGSCTTMVLQEASGWMGGQSEHICMCAHTPQTLTSGLAPYTA